MVRDGDMPGLCYDNPRMRRMLLSHNVLLTIALALFLAAPGPALAGARDSDGEEFMATLKSVTRFVRVQATPKGKPVQGKPGMRLKRGTQVFTLAKSRCEIEFGRGHFLRLASNAKIVIQRMSRKRPKQTLLQLLKGRVRALVDRARGDGNFGVYGATTITAVKGTEFDMVRGADGKVEVAVNEGKVWVAELEDPDNIEAVEKVFMGVILGTIGFGLTEGNMLSIIPGSPFPTSPIPIPKGFPNPWAPPKSDAKKGTGVPGAPKPPGMPGMPGPGGFGF